MKIFVTILLIAGLTNTYGQLEKCGLDNNTNLNVYEVKFLNDYYKDFRGSFNFKDKKIVYITSPSGNEFTDKAYFFSEIKEWKTILDERIRTELTVFTQEEREKSGGYDAIISIWVKVVTTGRKKKVIKLLGASKQ